MIKRHLEAALDRFAIVTAEAPKDMPIRKFIAAKQDEDRIPPHPIFDFLGTENAGSIGISEQSEQNTRLMSHARLDRRHRYQLTWINLARRRQYQVPKGCVFY